LSRYWLAISASFPKRLTLCHPVLRLQSEKHDQDLIVLSGDTGNVLAFGPGLSSETSYVNDSSSLMISAHRDTHFAFLEHVAIGDEITVTGIDNISYSYQVSSIEIVDTDHYDIIIRENQSEIKLVTCYPFNAVVTGGSLRHVVTIYPAVIEKLRILDGNDD